VLDRAAEAGDIISVAKKGGDEFTGIYTGRIHQTERNEDAQLFTASVVGGTAWLFSRVDFDASFDYLFVDEAGQVSVANIVAMATCAKNFGLVGDPMQLPQPIQGAHPGESGLSALEYLLTGHNTVPADRGIFLPVSRRMHPDVCRFISETIYEGRLTSDEGSARQKIFGDPNRHLSGTHLIEVSHAGNSQSSPEEVAAIRSEIEFLLGKRFRNRDGKVSCTRFC
jgi:superfamily I DNA and/or RNA helicase